VVDPLLDASLAFGRVEASGLSWTTALYFLHIREVLEIGIALEVCCTVAEGKIGYRQL
jgi:hypothetical protein